MPIQRVTFGAFFIEDRVPAVYPPLLTYAAAVKPAVLIVEDDVLLSEALALLIEQSGVPVDRCQSAAVAVELLAAKRYGLLVVDLMLLDGASGVYVIDSLRNLREADRPPVLIITACNVDNLRSIDRCAVKAIILKPIDLPLFKAYAMATYVG